MNRTVTVQWQHGLRLWEAQIKDDTPGYPRSVLGYGGTRCGAIAQAERVEGTLNHPREQHPNVKPSDFFKALLDPRNGTPIEGSILAEVVVPRQTGRKRDRSE